jgi:hypothetical protein
MQLALRICRSALPRRAFHPVVSYSWRRGFYRPRCGSNVLVDQYGCFGLSGHQAELENWCITRKQRTLLAFRPAGFSKFDDLCQILNYLLASLVRSSFAECGRAQVAFTPKPNLALLMRTDIPAQRNHGAACECIGYVLSEVIGAEGGWFLRLLHKGVKYISRLFSNSSAIQR